MMEEMFLEKLQEDTKFPFDQSYNRCTFSLGENYNFSQVSYNNKNDIDMSYQSTFMYPKLSGKFDEAYTTEENTTASKTGDKFAIRESDLYNYGDDNYDAVNSNDSTNASGAPPMKDPNSTKDYYNGYGKEMYTYGKDGKDSRPENPDKAPAEAGAGPQYPFYVNTGIMPNYSDNYNRNFGVGYNGGFRQNYVPFGNDFTDNYAEYVNEVGTEFKEPENSTIDNESIESIEAGGSAANMNVNMNSLNGFGGLNGGAPGCGIVGGMGLDLANMPFKYQNQGGDLQSDDDIKPPLNRSDPIYTSISGLKWKSKSKKWVVRWDNPITNRRVYKYFSGNRYGFMGAHKRAKFYLEFLNASVGKVNATTPGNPFCRRSEGPPKGKTNKSLIRKYYNSNGYQGMNYMKGPDYNNQMDVGYNNGMVYYNTYSNNGFNGLKTDQFTNPNGGDELGPGSIPNSAVESAEYYNYIYNNVNASNKISMNGNPEGQGEMVGSSMDNPWYTGQHY